MQDGSQLSAGAGVKFCTPSPGSEGGPGTPSIAFTKLDFIFVLCFFVQNNYKIVKRWTLPANKVIQIIYGQVKFFKSKTSSFKHAAV